MRQIVERVGKSGEEGIMFVTPLVLVGPFLNNPLTEALTLPKPHAITSTIPYVDVLQEQT